MGEEAEFRPDENLYDAIDFSRVPSVSDDLLSLLGDAPIFYKTGNFKTILREGYLNVQKKAHALAVADAADTEAVQRDYGYNKDPVSYTHLDVYKRQI